MGAISGLRAYKMRFNPTPWKTSQQTWTKKVTTKNDKFVELHVEVAKQVDTLIKQIEKERRFENWDESSKQQTDQQSEHILSNDNKTLMKN
jgi:hypothetical protein